MVGAKGDEIGKVICSALRSRCYMMDIGSEIKTTDYTTMDVAYSDLRKNIFITTTLPVAIVFARNYGGMMLVLAVSIAVIMVMYLTRKAAQFVATIIAVYRYFVDATRLRYKTLPSAIASVVATRYPALTRPRHKRGATDGTGVICFATTVIAVICAFVLVGIYKARLILAWILCNTNGLTASASTKYYIIRHDISSYVLLYKTIILAYYSYDKHKTTLSAPWAASC